MDWQAASWFFVVVPMGAVNGDVGSNTADDFGIHVFELGK